MLLERFLNYVKISTPSSYSGSAIPSTGVQLEFLKLLQYELEKIGLDDIEISKNSVLFATIMATEGSENEPIVGLISHIDTSPDAPSDKISPIVHKNYDGRAIELPFSLLDPIEYPEMLDFVGDTIITSDGSTLLGADDKAGVAIMMELADILTQRTDIKHGKIRLAFTCDEEIGTSINSFDIRKFGADFAYTLDSGGYALLEFENFNAASAEFLVTGKNIHPGYGYQKMINACDIVNEIHTLVPSDQRPVSTLNREGFYHLHDFCATVDSAKMKYIIREFDSEIFKQRKDVLQQICTQINKKYPNSTQLKISDSYHNMRSYIPDFVIDRAREAYKRVGIKPREQPIRGGTDGARLSLMGLPTPNLFNGGMNFHSKDEYCSLNAMQKALDMVIELIKV